MFFIAILSLIPVIIWSYMEPLGSRFSDLNTIFTSIGQILGLVGMVMFSINLILAGKFKFLDKYFKGLDKVYINHSKIGAIAFSLILFHPLFLVVKYITISLNDAALFFVPFVNTPITWGILSLLLMIILISFTFYIKLKYHVWKFSHKFMVVAFFFAIIHTVLIGSDISRSILLRLYILIFSFVGLFISVRQAFLNKFIKKIKYKVIGINYLNKDILEIEMEPLGEKVSFIPGQFAFFSFISDIVSFESHPFSIASSNLDNNIKIAVKNFGDYTDSLKDLKVNDLVLIDGPYGNFSHRSVTNKNQIWIAGGIGITPFLSMSKDLNEEYNVDLYYSVKEHTEAVCIAELGEIEEKNKNFKPRLWDAGVSGYITAEAIAVLSKVEGKDIFLCGPKMFMESLKDQFLLLEVDIKKIHYENFSF